MFQNQQKCLKYELNTSTLKMMSAGVVTLATIPPLSMDQHPCLATTVPASTTTPLE